jgi:hypothetical protein
MHLQEAPRKAPNSHPLQKESQERRLETLTALAATENGGGVMRENKENVEISTYSMGVGDIFLSSPFLE